MELSLKRQGSAVIATLQGKLDTVAARDFDSQFNELLKKDFFFYVLDLSGLDYICSAGLRTFVAGAKALKKREGRIIFVGVQGHVLEVFKIAYFHNIFRMVSSLEDALKEVRNVKVLGRLKLPAALSNHTKFLALVDEQAKMMSLEPPRITNVHLAVEESLANIFQHAYPKGKGDIEIICKLDESKFIVEIYDSGIAFDPMAGSGMGTFLIKKLVSHIDYKRQGDQNVLRFILPL